MCYLHRFMLLINTILISRTLPRGLACIPTHIRKYTVLRAPQIDKRSREPFELRTYKRVYRYPMAYSPLYKYM